MTRHHGAKLFGHRSHAGGNRKRLDKDGLADWAKKMDKKYSMPATKRPKRKKGEG